MAGSHTLTFTPGDRFECTFLYQTDDGEPLEFEANEEITVTVTADNLDEPLVFDDSSGLDIEPTVAGEVVWTLTSEETTVLYGTKNCRWRLRLDTSESTLVSGPLSEAP